MKNLCFVQWIVVLLLPNPILVATQAWAQVRPGVAPTTTSSVPSAIAENQLPQVVITVVQTTPTSQEAPREQEYARYTAHDAKTNKELSKHIPDFRGVALGFDGPVSGDIRAALMLKYSNIQVTENCDSRPVVCVFVGRVDSKGYMSGYGFGSDAASSYRYNPTNNRSRSGYASTASSINYQNHELQDEVNVVLFTEEFRPQLIGYVSNLAFPGTSSSYGYVGGSEWKSRATNSGYRSGDASWQNGGGGTFAASEDEALRESVNDGIKRLFGASLDNWLVRGSRRIDNRIHPIWMPYASEALARAFGSNG